MSPVQTLSAPPAAAGERIPGDDRGYTIGQAVELTGLSEHTLRYYERARLLAPVQRQRSSRHRRYSAEDIARLQTLACLRAAGVPLDGMRRYFTLIEQGASAAPLLRGMLADQRKVLEARLAEIGGHLAYLDRKISYWRAIEDGDGPGASAIVRELYASFDCSTSTTGNR